MGAKGDITGFVGLSMGAVKMFIDTGMDFIIGALTITCFVYSIRYYRLKIKNEKKKGL